MNKTKITNFNVNWLNIKNLCRSTISMKDSKIEPNDEWKRKLLIARHSPLRNGTIMWKWEEIPYAISTHFARHHIGTEKYVSTSREDRTGVPRYQRSQMDSVSMTMEANIEALQNIAEKRLCTCADKTTREYMMDLKDEIKKYDEDIAWSLVPSCIRCGGCIEEFSNCKFYENLSKEWTIEEQKDIKTRYNKYEEYSKKRVRK